MQPRKNVVFLTKAVTERREIVLGLTVLVYRDGVTHLECDDSCGGLEI